MHMRPSILLIQAIQRGLCAAAMMACGAALPAKDVDFNREIRPILSNRCFACHGPDSAAREADLRLDVEEIAKADRDGHAAIVPGDVDHSELIRRITSSDDDERMPPAESGKPLKPEEIDLLKRWIEGGAKWSLAWSYVPPAKQNLPPVRDASWPINGIDHFILARLEAEGLKPSAEADKTTLIRRLYIDLIGLPPAPEEVDEFLADNAPMPTSNWSIACWPRPITANKWPRIGSTSSAMPIRSATTAIRSTPSRRTAIM